MPTSVLEEKAYYEARYAPFLAFPADSLRFTPRQFLKDLEDPSKEVHERLLLYAATLRKLSTLSLRGKRVLDYGCGTGDFGLWMAVSEGANVTFLDLSENAVALCLRRAELSGVGERCQGVACDAADLSCFPDQHFDLVFGCASLHHTMKYQGSWAELLRVLKPDASLVLTETYGENPILNALRRWNWKREGLDESQGEDIIFGNDHIRLLRQGFESVELQPFSLLSMSKRALRGRLHQPLPGALYRWLRGIDAAMIAAFPPVQRLCGEVLVTAQRKRSVEAKGNPRVR